MNEIALLKAEFEEIKNSQQQTILDDYGIVDDADVYIECLNSNPSALHNYYVMDYSIIKNASKLMTGPVVCYQGKAFEVETIKFKTMKEMREFLNDKQYLLYVIVAVATIEYSDVIAAKSLFSEIKTIGANTSYLFRGRILE